jgi:hypothetical protein
LLSKRDKILVGRRPIGIASIAVENQVPSFQSLVELLLAKFNGLIVVVRTDNLESIMVAHEPFLFFVTGIGPDARSVSADYHGLLQLR